MSPILEKKYCSEQLSAREAQRMAQFIAWGPVVFQVGRLMLKWGLLEALRQAPDEGLTRQQLCAKTGVSDYAAKCLLEASLSIGLVLTDIDASRYTLSKTGWFLLNDEATRVNIDFVHDVNYEGMFHLEEALRHGRPEGLRHFGPWSTIYEGLSSLPADVQHSWFAFDHYYSDSSFDQALPIVFGDASHPVRTLYDVGGNTGRWALKCVGFNPQVKITVVDLPQQLKMMQANISGHPGAERIDGYAANVLMDEDMLPALSPDAIWMSQFLDCFSMEQITGILRKASQYMSNTTRLFIMETLWDRQRFETATLCLTMTSLYFAAMANGNSKMYNTADMHQCIREAGMEIEHIHDHLGMGHSLIVVRKK